MCIIDYDRKREIFRRNSFDSARNALNLSDCLYNRFFVYTEFYCECSRIKRVADAELSGNSAFYFKSLSAFSFRLYFIPLIES